MITVSLDRHLGIGGCDGCIVDPVPAVDSERPSLFPDDLLETECTGSISDRIWWLVYTRSRQEKVVAEQLAACRVPFYLPLIVRTSLSRGRPRSAEVPLFPGYVFLCGTNEERVLGLKTNRIVTTQPVDDGEKLRRDLWKVSQLIASGAPLTPEARLKAGDKVRVKDGAFAGLEGEVLMRRGKTRLFVVVELLGQGVSMEINDYLLEPI